MIIRLHTAYGNYPYSIEAAATVTADGVNMEVFGGQRPHVGAVAFGVPRPSLDDPARMSSNVTVVPRLGHKDDEIARTAAGRAARILGTPVVVVVGIHIDQASPDDIALLVDHTNKALDQLLDQILSALSGSRG